MCDSQGKCVSIHVFIQSQMLTLFLFTLPIILYNIVSEEYFYADKYIISYCKPQVTGNCKNLVLQDFHV